MGSESKGLYSLVQNDEREMKLENRCQRRYLKTCRLCHGEETIQENLKSVFVDKQSRGFLHYLYKFQKQIYISKAHVDRPEYLNALLNFQVLTVAVSKKEKGGSS